MHMFQDSSVFCFADSFVLGKHLDRNSLLDDHRPISSNLLSAFLYLLHIVLCALK